MFFRFADSKANWILLVGCEKLNIYEAEFLWNHTAENRLWKQLM